MIDVVSVKQMQDFDKHTIETKMSSIELMNLAANAIFEEYDFSGKNVYIICGSGNNGGDGLALANIMVSKKMFPKIFLVSDKISNDAKYYLDQLKSKGYNYIFPINNCDYECDVIVDCLLGTGFKGLVREDVSRVINAINKSKAYVISADIPSGLNGDNGQAFVSVKADKTIAIQYLKTGHFLNDGKDYIGEIVYKDIGIEKTEEVAKIIEDSDISFSKRKNNSSKLSYGRSLIIGGCENFVGAVKIANMGVSSLRVGCGLNTIAAPKSLSIPIQSCIIESTFYPLDETSGHICFNEAQIKDIMKNMSAVAIGMGMGNNYEENRKLIEYIICNYSIPVLLDADAINSFKDNIEKLTNGVKSKLILTPHVKEMARLMGCSELEIIDNPIEKAKKLASKLNCTVLLKGASSVVTNGKDVYMIVNGGPELSKGGSGDTLSGVILGLLAQGYDVCYSAYCGAYLCAKAAKDLKNDYSQYGVLASDVAKKISDYITE